MPDSPAPPDARPEDAADATAGATAFGEREPTRFAADVEYRGRSKGHDYLVRVRHRFLDSSFTVILDGVEHDPKAEEKALRKRDGADGDGQESKRTGTGTADDVPPDGSPADAAVAGTDAPDGHAGPEQEPADAAAVADGLRFRLEENFTVLHCTVRRPDEDGELKDAEVISVRTAGLGGAGEVDVRHGLDRTLLLPADDSPSAAREAKRTAHPTRYALLAALAKAAGFLLPLLGFGALFSGLLDPVKDWIAARIRPVLDALTILLEPVREWIAGVLRPIGEFLDSLLAPVREAVAALLRPFVQAWDWLMDLLFGWIPDLSLPFSVPEWVLDVAVPVLVVLVVFAVTFSSLRRRQEKLEATREATDAARGVTDEPNVPNEPSSPNAPDDTRGGSREDRATAGERVDGDREGGPAPAMSVESQEGAADPAPSSGSAQR